MQRRKSMFKIFRGILTTVFCVAIHAWSNFPTNLSYGILIVLFLSVFQTLVVHHRGKFTRKKYCCEATLRPCCAWSSWSFRISGSSKKAWTKIARSSKQGKRKIFTTCAGIFFLIFAKANLIIAFLMENFQVFFFWGRQTLLQVRRLWLHKHHRDFTI